MNGWNDVQDNNSAKTVGAAVSIKPNDRFSLIQNYMVGAEQPDNNDDVRHLFDTVVSYTLTSEGQPARATTTTAATTSRASRSTGPASPAYLKYQHNDRLAFIPRFEVLWDSKAFATGTPQTVKELTLTGEYKIRGPGHAPRVPHRLLRRGVLPEERRRAEQEPVDRLDRRALRVHVGETVRQARAKGQRLGAGRGVVPASGGP